MSRRYRKVTLTTLTIDCAHFLMAMPFRIVRKSYQYSQRPKPRAFDAMSGLQFEQYVAQILQRRGYRYIRLTERYDYGVDIIAEKDGIRWGIQVKRYSGLVKASAVRQVVTALRLYDCDRAMVITNSHYSRVAANLAKSNNCVLVDRKQLIGWLR